MGRGIGSSLIDSGIPMPIMPTENIGIMSGAIRKPKAAVRRDKFNFDKRGSRRREDGRAIAAQVTMKDPKTGRLYGGLVKDGIPQFEKPDFVSEEDFNKSFPKKMSPKTEVGIGDFMRDQIKQIKQPGFDPSKPSAVQETTRVNVQDPTLGGPPEREVPLPKEKDMTPRGPAPFAPNEEDVAKQRFFETMFERATNRKERSDIDRSEMRDRQEARRDEAMMRDSEMGGRRRGRRDFTRRRPERRRSREERAAFRDRYVSTLGSNFFS